MKYYEFLYLVLIIVYIGALMYMFTTTDVNIKKMLPPQLQNLSKRNVVIYSLVGGTIVGVIVASFIWFLLHTACKGIFGIYRECFEEEQEKDDEKKEKKVVDNQ